MHLLVSKGHQGVSGKSRTVRGTDHSAAPGKLATVQLDGSSSAAGSSINTNGTTSPKKLEKPQEVLPCPRCESMNTKFCYYNNYSVNQPRHFCRQCQRYWTVGGTLRNVPVGGGSRKRNRRGTTEPFPRPPPGNRHGAFEPAPLAMATPSTNMTASFQQFLAHEVPGSFLFSQITNPYGSYPVVDQTTHYIPPPSSKQNLLPPIYGTAVQTDNVTFPGSNSLSSDVKSEFWSQVQQPVWDQSRSDDPAAAPSEENPMSSGGYESSMLLQLGLTNEPAENINHGSGTARTDLAAVSVALKNSSSPPHGSSTIEEEGNTPTNCYVEEGDAVSSMWAQNIHDIQDILSSTL